VFIDSVRTVLGDAAKGDGPWRFNDVSTAAMVRSNGVRSKIYMPAGHWGKYFRFKGAWDRDGELAGFNRHAFGQKWRVARLGWQIVLDGIHNSACLLHI